MAEQPTAGQRRALVAPAIGIGLVAAGGVAWLAAGWPVPGALVALAGLAVLAWGLLAQQRDPVLRARRQPPMPGGGGSEGGR